MDTALHLSKFVFVISLLATKVVQFISYIGCLALSAWHRVAKAIFPFISQFQQFIMEAKPVKPASAVMACLQH